MIIAPKTLSDQLLYSTVRIETVHRDNTVGVGTGFFFNIPLDANRHVPVIITNKHVVNNADVGSFVIHESEIIADKHQPAGKFLPVKLNNFSNRWIHHPANDVDLCAMPFQPLNSEANQKGKTIFYIPLVSELIWNETKLAELSAVEDLLMVGYPIGLYDKMSNLPIFRRGITAMHPAIDFENKSIGVVDMAVFPGSSGSPVLIVNEGWFKSPTGALSAGSRAILLGVLFSMATFGVEGKIIVKDIPTGMSPVSQSQIPINIGYYVKAKEITALGDHVINVFKEKGGLS